MKKFSIAMLVLLTAGLSAQQGATPAAPDIPFDVQDVIRMPPDLYLGEIAGLAMNSKKHIFVYTRTGADDGSRGAGRQRGQHLAGRQRVRRSGEARSGLQGAARIQVLDNDLNYVREIKYDPPQAAGAASRTAGGRQ